MKIKICGLTRKQDVDLAVSLGADAVGFIFYEKSKRFVDVTQVKALLEDVPSTVLKVGVFVNANRHVIESAIQDCGLSTIQLHGDERPDDCLGYHVPVVKAFNIGSEDDLAQIPAYQESVDTILLDAKVPGQYGGTGKVFNWDLLKQVSNKAYNVIVSGGITPENVLSLVRQSPYAIDVSSGVESSPGIKSETLMRRFFEACGR